MISFLFGLPACFSAFFRSRYNLSLEIIALRQQLGVFKRKNPRPHLQIRDRMFWILLRRIWPSSSNRKPLSPGTEPDFVCSGEFDHGQRALAGRKSMPRFEL